MSEDDDMKTDWEIEADREFEEKMKNQTPEERAAHFRQIYNAVTNNPELFKDFPPDLLESVREGAEKLEKANRDCDIAIQNVKIAVAKRDALGAVLDAILADPDIKDTEH